MLKASIDLGTNTCLLLIAKVEAEKVEKVEDITNVVRLGEGVDINRSLAEVAIARTLTCLEKYSDTVKKFGISPQSVVCVATSQARDAKNCREFFEIVESRTGFTFKTLSGQEEAHFTFLGGLLPGLDKTKSAVIDIGGGSTELMSLNGGMSVDVGSVRFTERYLKVPSSSAVSDKQFWACWEALDRALSPLVSSIKFDPAETQLVAVAGSATTLAAWHLGLKQYDADKIDQVVLSLGDIHRMVEELKWRSPEERRILPGMEKGREDIILAGAMILWRTMELAGFKDCRVSSRGLRYGVLQN